MSCHISRLGCTKSTSIPVHNPSACCLRMGIVRTSACAATVAVTNLPISAKCTSFWIAHVIAVDHMCSLPDGVTMQMAFDATPEVGRGLDCLCGYFCAPPPVPTRGCHLLVGPPAAAAAAGACHSSSSARQAAGDAGGVGVGTIVHTCSKQLQVYSSCMPTPTEAVSPQLCDHVASGIRWPAGCLTSASPHSRVHDASRARLSSSAVTTS